jgi:hypothetical protein
MSTTRDLGPEVEALVPPDVKDPAHPGGRVPGGDDRHGEVGIRCRRAGEIDAVLPPERHHY